ncbi:MAG: hypothetical protein ABIW96_09790 [Polaromonas sp.]
MPGSGIACSMANAVQSCQRGNDLRQHAGTLPRLVGQRQQTAFSELDNFWFHAKTSLQSRGFLGIDTHRAEEFCAKSEIVQGTPDQRAIRSPLHMAGFAQRDGAVVF